MDVLPGASFTRSTSLGRGHCGFRLGFELCSPVYLSASCQAGAQIVIAGRLKEPREGGKKSPLSHIRFAAPSSGKGKQSTAFPTQTTDAGGMSGDDFTLGELIAASLLPHCRVIMLSSPSLGAQGVSLWELVPSQEVQKGGVDYLQLLHPSRSFGSLRAESCTARAHGNKSGLFFPTKSLLNLLCACSARSNASAARIAFSGLCC